jgi:hypothetical protein
MPFVILVRAQNFINIHKGLWNYEDGSYESLQMAMKAGKAKPYD